MLYFFCVFLLIVVIAVIRGSKVNNVLNGGGYLSREYTQTIKGIFIILVFFSHFNAYVKYSVFADKAYSYAVIQVGQMMVTMFLFYSGYGVMESIRKKGMGYIQTIPKHRVLGTLVKFDIVVCVFAILNYLLGKAFSLPVFLEALVAWQSIGNSNWYIFAILVLYLFTYLSGIITKGNPLRTAIMVSIFTALYIILLMLVRYEEAQYYNTVICYPLGLFFSIYRDSIERFLKSKTNYVVVLALLVLLLFVTKAFIKSGTSPLIIFEALVFSILVVVLTMRTPIKSGILSWCGNYLFEIYILQRLPMGLFKSIGLSDYNIYVYFLACLAVTIILALLFRKSTKWIRL